MSLVKTSATLPFPPKLRFSPSEVNCYPTYSFRDRYLFTRIRCSVDSHDSSSDDQEQKKSKYKPNQIEFWQNVFGELDESLLGPLEPLTDPPFYVTETFPDVIDDDLIQFCGLCGYGDGWIQCNPCNGEGKYITSPGKAGVSHVVGWARCKSCYGRGVVPCPLCGIEDPDKWLEWQQHARRRPVKIKPEETSDFTELYPKD